MADVQVMGAVSTSGESWQEIERKDRQRKEGSVSINPYKTTLAAEVVVVEE
jgi:hypothetical protein